MSRVERKRNKPIIGLVGGIGAGKSSVASILESLGAAVIDSDRLTHDELRDAEVIATLRTWWGARVCPDEGSVDRQAVASIVFDDPAELTRLEALLYPRLARRREELIRVYSADQAVVAIVLDAPKLYEAGLHRLCDAVIFVEADREVRLKRLATSRGWSERQLRKRENLQKSLDEKRAIADYAIVNHSAVADLRPAVERVLAAVLASFS
ncbi:MAG: dephospho-CoA kinase [Phycisphaerae bacterium]